MQADWAAVSITGEDVRLVRTGTGSTVHDGQSDRLQVVGLGTVKPVPAPAHNGGVFRIFPQGVEQRIMLDPITVIESADDGPGERVESTALVVGSRS